MNLTSSSTTISVNLLEFNWIEPSVVGVLVYGDLELPGWGKPFRQFFCLVAAIVRCRMSSKPFGHAFVKGHRLRFMARQLAVVFGDSRSLIIEGGPVFCVPCCIAHRNGYGPAGKKGQDLRLVLPNGQQHIWRRRSSAPQLQPITVG